MKKILFIMPLLCLGLFSCGGKTPEPEVIHKINFDGGEYLSIDTTECKDQNKLLAKVSVKDEYLSNYEAPQNEIYYDITCNDKEIKNFSIYSNQGYDSVYLEIPKEEVVGDINIKTSGYCHYLTFTAEADTSIYYYHPGPAESDPDFKYCTDLNNQEWIDWEIGEENKIWLKGENKTIYVKNANNILHSGSSSVTFNLGNSENSPKVSSDGNIMSLLNYDNLYTACFTSLFNNNKALTSAPVLPATTLADYCYQWLFEGCSSLLVAPKLPATTLTTNCYQSMFSQCSSLTKTPELPATTLAPQCYVCMFINCSSLIEVSDLPATSLTSQCYNNMFVLCTSLEKPPKILATTLSDYSCYAMFINCSSLKVNNKGIGTKFFDCPLDTTPNNCVKDMFVNTGGEFKGTPVENTSYYYE